MRILLISYYFPPYNTVGAVRPGKFAKYLVKHGHEVEVICASEPPFPKGLPLEISSSLVHPVTGWSVNAPLHLLLGGSKRLSQSDFSSVASRRPWLRILGRAYKTLFHWPDAEIGWTSAAFAHGMNLINARPFDLIYTSSPPFSSLRIGAKLAASSGIPWVADFRDLWTCNHAYDPPKWKLRLEQYWERYLLRNASALTTVSSPLSIKLLEHRLPVWVVRNGYDKDDFNEHNSINIDYNKNELLIVYTGSIYPDYYDLDAFCAGIKIFSSNGYQVRVKIVGRNVSSILEVAERHNILSLFEISSTVSRPDALSLQKHADVLLMFLWGSGDEGIYTTKFFEYIGAGKPLLAVGSIASDVGSWIVSAKLGAVARTSREVADHLALLYHLKVNGQKYPISSVSREEFTRDKQYSYLLAHLQSLITTSA